MEIIDISNKKELSTIIISELKAYGVKYQKDKKKKNIEKPIRKNIFSTHLHVLDLTEVILANGKVVQIPKFVAEACNRVLEQVETEGIFRKAGSFVRQKEIRMSLETGVALGKLHHVIDVANVIKYFFRELPEPLIPACIQETLLRCLLVGDNLVKAMLLACLLLPPITRNTLSFFMQFLYTVSLSEKHNKMSVENLAIIFTPSLMPFPNMNSHRFTNHVKVVGILIENANAIGNIPISIENKLQQHLKKITLEARLPDDHIHTLASVITENGRKSESAKKKKKRRSDMFNGLRRIVGSAMGSSEFLDHTLDGNKTSFQEAKSVEIFNNEKKECDITSPCLKEHKKRKYVDPVSTLSAKKETKKSRLSLGSGRHIKNITLNPVITSMERRWSIVGTGWSKSKNKHAPNMKCCEYNNCNCCHKEVTEDANVSSNLTFDFERRGQFSENVSVEKNIDELDDNSFCIQVPKREYEEIKERVATIECHISNEFRAICNSPVLQSLPLSTSISNAEHVQTQYERTVIKTEALALPATEQLAKRLSRGLNIRRNGDQRIIRSPSARKIGNIRRRSQDKVHLSRNSSWHIRSSNNGPINTNSIPLLKIKSPQNQLNQPIFYNTNKQKPVYPNSPYLKIESLHSREHILKKSSDNILNTDYLNEQWMSGEDFFSGTMTKEPVDKLNEHCFDEKHVEHVEHVEDVATPVRLKINMDIETTPMLPPKSLPRKISNIRTPSSHTKNSSTANKLPYINRISVTTPVNEEISGRASIARLRSQNAGMVLAKAKLFDGLESNKQNTEQHSKNIDQSKKSLELHQKRNIAVHSNCYSRPAENSISFKKSSPVTQSDNAQIKTKSLKSTPLAKRIQNSNLCSPASGSKQNHHVKLSKLSQTQLIKSIVTDDKLTKSNSLNWDNKTNTGTKADTFKTFNHQFRNTKSPRRIKKNCRQLKRNTSGIQFKNNT